MEKGHLHLLIDEEIYLIDSQDSTGKLDAGNGKEEGQVKAKEEVEGDAEDSVVLTVASSSEEGSRESKVTSDEPKVEKDTQESEEKIVVDEHIDEAPDIPSIPATAPATSVKYAFFHNTDQPEELDLLNKIIDACKLADTDFKVLKVGQEVVFEKAVVFTKSGPSYYVSTQHERGVVMYAQPLATLMLSKEEKGKLWGALQKFVRR